MSETSGTIILLKLLKTVEINYVIFPLSLKYLQNKKKKKNKYGIQKSGCGKPGINEVMGWFCQYMEYILVSSWKAVWQDAWNIFTEVLL